MRMRIKNRRLFHNLAAFNTLRVYTCIYIFDYKTTVHTSRCSCFFLGDGVLMLIEPPRLFQYSVRCRYFRTNLLQKMWVELERDMSDKFV